MKKKSVKHTQNHQKLNVEAKSEKENKVWRRRKIKIKRQLEEQICDFE